MEWEEAIGSVGGGRWSKECGIWVEGWIRETKCKRRERARTWRLFERGSVQLKRMALNLDKMG